jgi:hypothetical protein
LAAHLIWPQPDSCLIFSLSFQGVIALKPARRCYSVSRLPSLRSPIQSLNQSLLTLPLPEYAISYSDRSARYFSSCKSLPPTGLVLEALHPRARSEAATRRGDPMILTTQSNSDRSNKRKRLNDPFQPHLQSGHHGNVDGSHPKIDAVVLDDRHHDGFGDFQLMQIDYQYSISVQIPTPKTQLQVPWSEWDRVYCDKGHPSDAVEEGPVINERLGYDFWSRQSKQYNLLQNGREEAFIILNQQNPTDTQQHLHPPSTETGHAYEEGERANTYTPDSLTRASNRNTPAPLTRTGGSSPTSSPTHILPNQGRRRRPPPPTIKENANKMRKKGSCYRCYIMKERCVMTEQGELDGTCKRCREILHDYRTWVLPCSNIKLQDRLRFMLPEVLFSHLRRYKVREYIKLHTNERLIGSSFKLALGMDFDTPLILDVVEFDVPPDQKNTPIMEFQLTSGGSSTDSTLDSPPVMPVLVDRFSIWRQLYIWLESINREESKFPLHCFPESHEDWQREILTDICTHYRECISGLGVQEKDPFGAFRWAMKLTVLNHIMCHPFTVPNRDVESLLGRLHNYKPTGSLEWVCPRVVNKVIKHYCVPMLETAGQQLLKQLDTIFRSNKITEAVWDQTFSIVFLCLIVIGKNQVALSEKARICVINGDDSLTVEQAMNAVMEMENDLAEHLIGMFHERFSTKRRKRLNPFAKNPEDRPQYMTRLMGSIGSATELYGNRLCS